MANINMWMYMIPVFLLESAAVGYLTRDTRSSRLTDLLQVLVYGLNSILILVSIWTDSYLGIVQLAEDLTAANEDSAFAFGGIAIGTVIFAIIFVGVQLVLSDIISTKFASPEAKKSETPTEVKHKVTITEKQLLQSLREAHESGRIVKVGDCLVVDITVNTKDSSHCA